MAGSKKDPHFPLHDSERQFRFLVDNLNGMVYRCANDSEWTMEFVSAYAEELTGYSPDQLIGNRDFSFASLIHPDDSKRIWDEIQQALSHQTTFQITYRISTASGEEKHVWEQGRGVFDTNGHVLALEGYITDITKRTKLEQELRNQEELFRLLADNSLDVIWRMGTDMRFTYVSPSIHTTLGYTPEEYIGTCLSDYCTREHFDYVISIIESSLKEGRADRGELMEMELRHKDGRMIPVEVHGKALLDNQGNLCELQGSTRDITGRVKSRQELANARELLEKIFSSLTDALIVIDYASGFIVTCNPAMQEVFGYSEAEVLGRTIEFLHVDREQFIEISGKCVPLLEKTGVFRAQIPMRRKDGSIIDTEHTVSIIRDDAGVWKYSVGVIRDISSNKLSEQHQAELQEQLYQSQKLEAVGRLAGGIAHDFNNLLSVIVGYSDIMLQEKDLHNRYRDNIEDIHGAAIKASKLTRQLLAFSRKQTLEMKVLDLNELITDFQKLLDRVIGDDIELRIALSYDNTMVIADPSQLEQVLMNLAVNARDAMPDGGRITIKTSLVDIDGDQDLEPGRYISLCFTDNGTGMDEEVLSHIFEPFFTTKGLDKSSGLGLATTFGIIRQHGGDITVESRPGEGTTFTILLPLECGESMDAGATGMAGPVAKSGPSSVMIVEDDQQVLRLARCILTTHGHQVHAFSDAQEALDWAIEYRQGIDVLLSDVVMPGIKGPELYRQLKELHPETRVLYMSGYEDGALSGSDTAFDNSHFIQKPFSMEELLRKLAGLLD